MRLSVMAEVIFDKATVFGIVEDVPDGARIKAAAPFRAPALFVQHVRNRVKRKPMAVQFGYAQNNRSLQIITN
jgi:hypothetical protein